MDRKRITTKKLLFYVIMFLIIASIQLISVFLYAQSINKTDLYLKIHFMPILLMMVLTFMMLYATGMVSYYRKRPGTWRSFSILQVLWYSFLSIFVAYATTSILFYTNKIGRTVFLYDFILLSLFFAANVEHFLKKTIRNNITYIWLCKNITPEELCTKYHIHIENFKSSITEQDTPENTVIIYDSENIKREKELIRKIVEGYTLIPVSTLIELEAGLVPLGFIDTFYHIVDFTSTRYFSDGIKVIMDFVLSPILLLILFPIAFMVALLHKLESEGPIFYKQLRSGKNGEPFYLLKFRTMIQDAEKHGRKFASKNDPRVTKIGRIMRKLRLDEVPQLLNVVKGEMSLIGPRPERPEFIEKFSKEIPYYRLRLKIKPGLTGWAQVHYKYTGPNLEEQIRRLEYDLYYIKNRNILLDMIVLIKTVGVMLKAEGV